MSRRRQVNRDMYLQCQACRQTTLSPGFAPFPNSRRCADSTSPLTIPPFSMLTPSGYPYVTFSVVPSSSPTTRSNVSFYVPNSCMYQGIPKRSCVRAFPSFPDLNSQVVTTTPCSMLPPHRAEATGLGKLSVDIKSAVFYSARNPQPTQTVMLPSATEAMPMPPI